MTNKETIEKLETELFHWKNELYVSSTSLLGTQEGRVDEARKEVQRLEKRLAVLKSDNGQ